MAVFRGVLEIFARPKSALFRFGDRFVVGEFFGILRVGDGVPVKNQPLVQADFRAVPADETFADGASVAVALVAFAIQFVRSDEIF